MIVLVPAYEPDDRLPDLVGTLLAADPGLRVLVVDDGSGAAYRPVFAAAAAAGATVLRHPVNRGKGRALKTGFAFVAEHFGDDDVVCADSDGQHGVLDVLRVAEQVWEDGGLVLGVRRFTGNVPLRSRFGNTVTRGLYRLATGRSVADTQTGLRGYPAALLPWLLSVRGERFEYEFNLLLAAPRHGVPIAQVEIATIYLEGNASSHFRPVADSVRIYAPLLAFLFSSLGAFAVDTGALLALDALTGLLLVAVVGARLVSASVNYLVNRRLVFAAPRSGRRSAVRYAVLAALLLAANATLLTAFTSLGLPLLAAKLVTEPLLIAVSFAAQARVVFPTRAWAVPVSRPPQAPVG